ncbi:MAG: hypothetical protein Q4G64_06050 [bacterium]|nr:hypothetical protein [bacterium]
MVAMATSIPRAAPTDDNVPLLIRPPHLSGNLPVHLERQLGGVAVRVLPHRDQRNGGREQSRQPGILLGRPVVRHRHHVHRPLPRLRQLPREAPLRLCPEVPQPERPRASGRLQQDREGQLVGIARRPLHRWPVHPELQITRRTGEPLSRHLHLPPDGGGLPAYPCHRCAGLLRVGHEDPVHRDARKDGGQVAHVVRVGVREYQHVQVPHARTHEAVLRAPLLEAHVHHDRAAGA